MLLKLLEEKNSDKVVVIFDSAKTFRNDIYNSYKANRGEAPEDLIPHEIIREAVDAFNITRVELPGCEADDLQLLMQNF